MLRMSSREVTLPALHSLFWQKLSDIRSHPREGGVRCGRFINDSLESILNDLNDLKIVVGDVPASVEIVK